MELAVAMSDVVKTFGRVRALDGLDLEARTGEVHGFLGPNGSGKTVTIRILLGMYRHDSGSAELLGGDPWHQAVELHRRVAYVPGDVNLWPSLSGGEVIDLLGRLQGGMDERRRSELIDRFDLDPTKRARTYSKGNRQKVALVAGLSADADLYVLDEPTAGLDPLMEAVFQDCILELAAEGRTVLLSSHILAEVERLCDRVSIIRRGRTVQTGTLEELRHLTRTSISVETERPVSGLDELSGIHGVTSTEHRLEFDVDSDHLDAAVAHLSGFGIRALTSHPPTLEELFLRHYGDELSEAGVANGNGDGDGDR